MGKKLYVGNLPYTTNDEELKNVFASAGTVVSAKVIMDRESGRSKGFGFVEMSTDAEAATAITTLNTLALGGRNLTVNEAKPMAPRTGGFGGGSRPAREPSAPSADFDSGFSSDAPRGPRERGDRRDRRDRY